MRNWESWALIMGITLAFTAILPGTFVMAAGKAIKVGSVLPLTGSLADTGRYNISSWNGKVGMPSLVSIAAPSSL